MDPSDPAQALPSPDNESIAQKKGLGDLEFEGLPQSTLDDIASYERITGRDPRVVRVTFLDAVNSDAAKDRATSEPKDLRIVERLKIGWMALKKAYPLDHKRYVKYKLKAPDQVPPLPARGKSNPWEGRVGWIEEPELPILTMEREAKGGARPPEEVPREAGYVLYNRLIAEFSYRPFRTQGGESRVAIPTEYGLEIGDPNAEEFQRAAGYSVFTVRGEPIPGRELSVATLALAGRAMSRILPGERIVRLWLRVAPNGLFSSRVDLADPLCRCVVLSPDGWTVEHLGHPVFDRRRHMLPLPDPVRAEDAAATLGQVDGLWDFVLLPPYPLEPGDNQRLLALTLLVQFLISPGTPKTVAVFPGDEGIGKSSSALALGQVVDPSLTGQVKVPQDEKELDNLTANRAVINFDNISKIDSQFSDYLARLSTGISQAKRLLYSNGDEVISQMLPQLILNGISSTPQAADVLRRAVFFVVVRPKETVSKEQLALRWTEAAPRIFARLLDLACASLRVLRDDPPPPTSSSMADFVRIGQAVAVARGGTREEFLEAWRVNCDRQNSAAASHPWVGVLYDFFSPRTVVSEAVSAAEIAKWVNENQKHVFGKPTDSQRVGTAVAKSKTTLARMGIFLDRKVIKGLPKYYRTDGSELRQESTKQLQLPDTLEPASPASPSSPQGGSVEEKSSGEASENRGEAPEEVHPGEAIRGEPTPQASPQPHPQPHPLSHVSGGIQGELGDPLSKVESTGKAGPAVAGPPLEGDASPLREESFHTGPNDEGSDRAASARRRFGYSGGSGAPSDPPDPPG